MAKYKSCSFVMLCIGLCFLVMSQSSEGLRQRSRSQRSSEEGRGRCQILSLNPHEPNQRVEHEAGVSEMWDQENEQMQCANVAAARYVIEPNGLYLPNFHSTPMLVYVVQGKGFLGTMMPGCPETYKSFQQGRRMRMRGERRESMEDEHQKLHFFGQGDILALPAGVAHWWYNDGDSNLVIVVMDDIGSNHNQLDQHLRKFFLAGNPEAQARHFLTTRERRLSQSIGNNIFKGFGVQILAEAFAVSEDTARQLQCEDDQRGSIIHVHEGLGVVRPPTSMRGRWSVNNSTMNNDEMAKNGLEETICSMKIRANIEDPERADVYTVDGGRISTLTSFDLPVLQYIQLSAKRGNLYRNAILSPQWNMNAHEIIYCIRGSARVQVVGSSSNNNRPVFDGVLKEGQLLVIPQNFAFLTKAGEEGFEWITFMTSENAVASPLSGRAAVMRAMPEEVLMNMYKISRQDAQRLKYSRQEMTLLSPRRMRASA